MDGACSDPSLCDSSGTINSEILSFAIVLTLALAMAGDRWRGGPLKSNFGGAPVCAAEDIKASPPDVIAAFAVLVEVELNEETTSKVENGFSLYRNATRESRQI